MRFIDMFMTALGSLLFMALLFVFLLAYLPKDAPRNSVPSLSTRELQVLTKVMPPGREGAGYELAIAYRGGTGRVAWTVTGELPPGIVFDRDSGVLSGVPSKKGSYRFVVTLHDGASQPVAKPYELEVAAAVVPAQRFNIWIAVILLVLLLLSALGLHTQANAGRRLVRDAERFYQEGAASMKVPRGSHRDEYIELPGGIEELKAQERRERIISRYMFAACALVAVYLAWVLWPS
jgi:Putative Ig domain